MAISSSEVLAVASAAVDTLNFSAFSPVAASATRVLRPKDRPSDLASPKIIVQPGAYSVERLSRDSQNREVTINVGVAQQFSGNPALYSQEVAKLMLLIEQAAERLRDDGLLGLGEWQWEREERVVVMDEEMVKENAIGFAQVAITYRRIG